MKWVVLAIALFIVGYTAVMVVFRKPGKAHEPYKEAVDRATVTRLLSAGYQRIPVQVERPSDPGKFTLQSGSGNLQWRYTEAGLQDELRIALPEPPVLAESYAKISAAPSAHSSAPYQILVTINMPDNKRVITGAQLLKRGNELTLVPETEALGGALQARWKDSVWVFTVPASSLVPGHYTLTLAGSKSSTTWELDLRQ